MEFLTSIHVDLQITLNQTNYFLLSFYPCSLYYKGFEICRNENLHRIKLLVDRAQSKVSRHGLKMDQLKFYILLTYIQGQVCTCRFSTTFNNFFYFLFTLYTQSSFKEQAYSEGRNILPDCKYFPLRDPNWQ